MTVFTNVKKEDAEKLVPKGSEKAKLSGTHRGRSPLAGFCKLEPKTMYEEFRCSKDGVTLILYSSGKLLLQGQVENVEKVAAELRKLKIGKEVEKESFRKESGWMIGSDEALKGDTFGGLVVAAVKANDKIREQLIELGVADSKKLTDKEIIPMAEEIKKIAPCEIKSLMPEEYNHVGKVTLLLNNLHHECGKYLKPGKHVVDKYPGCTVGDMRLEKAESKYVEVAAASVLARATGLKQLNYLSTLVGFTVPKGSTHVKEALQELKEKSLKFEKFVKTSFGNVEEFL